MDLHHTPCIPKVIPGTAVKLQVHVTYITAPFQLDFYKPVHSFVDLGIVDACNADLADRKIGIGFVVPFQFQLIQHNGMFQLFGHFLNAAE